jgi:hypothetical protein
MSFEYIEGECGNIGMEFCLAPKLSLCLVHVIREGILTVETCLDIV